MSDNAKRTLAAGAGILVALGVIIGLWLPVTALGQDCGTAFVPSTPLLASQVEEAACADARSARLPMAIAPIVVGSGLGLWRLSVRDSQKPVSR